MDDVHTSLLSPVVASQSQGPHTTTSSISDSYKGYELEDIFVSFGKRAWMQIDVIVMCFNTINACFAISAAVSLIPKYNYSDYTFCDYGDNGEPIGIGVQCPYLPSPTFISLLTIWTLYFLTIFIYKVHRTFDWWSNDLRFYMACDIINDDIFMYILVCVGIVLTIGSGLCGIYFVTQNGSDSSLGNIAIFVAVNLVNLHNMLGGEFRKLRGVDLLKTFPQPVIITLPSSSLSNLYGTCIPHRAVFDSIVQAAVLDQMEGNVESGRLSKIGKPDMLLYCISKILPTK